MGGRVFVVGSINVDMLMRLPFLPKPGETVLAGRFARTQGGKGANQAVATARLARPTTLIGAVGKDSFGDDALSELRTAGVDISSVMRVDDPTGVAVVVVGDDGENLIGVAPGANARLREGPVTLALSTRLVRDDVVVANLEVADEAVSAAATVARARGATFVLNPAPARALAAELLARCDVVTPNAIEVGRLGFETPSDLLATGLRVLIVTRGAEGADLYRRGQPVLHQEAFPVSVVDTTGAGDAFTAALSCALLDGEPFETALRWAAGAGSLATRALGARAGYADRDELARLLSDPNVGRQYPKVTEEVELA